MLTKIPYMKKIVMLLVAISIFSLISIHQASADHNFCRRLVGYTSCGEPIYAVYQICGYDRCGRPIGRWVTEYPSSRYEREEHRPHYSHDRESSRSRASWGFRIRF